MLALLYQAYFIQYKIAGRTGSISCLPALKLFVMKSLIIRRALAGLWIVLGILVFWGSLKEQVLLDHNLRYKVMLFFPQGWSFFTKSPRDEAMAIYRIEDEEIVALPVSNHENIGFGFGRTTRIIGYEASMVASKIHPSRWSTHTNQPIEDFIDLPVIELEKEEGFNHLVEGEYIFKLYKTIPFAWAGRQQEANNPFRISRVRIQ